MANDYQDMVYRCPGPHQRKGGTFDTRGVNSSAEHDAALKDGWFNTLPEAIEGKVSLVELPADAPPTRAELEQKAAELNIRFDKKTSNDDLAARIAKAIGA